MDNTEPHSASVLIRSGHRATFSGCMFGVSICSCCFTKCGHPASAENYLLAVRIVSELRSGIKTVTVQFNFLQPVGPGLFGRKQTWLSS